MNDFGTNTTENVTAQYSNASNLNARIELHKRFSTNKYGWSNWVFDQLDFDGKKRILELGCGNGDVWRSNIQRKPANIHVILSDFSNGMLETAKQSLVDVSNGFKFQVIDAQSIPYENESFDMVIANHMLYHVPDRKKALSEI
jgi:ubiquinone/menaquinone biosynthesis C-methylase UbiE